MRRPAARREPGNGCAAAAPAAARNPICRAKPSGHCPRPAGMAAPGSLRRLVHGRRPGTVDTSIHQPLMEAGPCPVAPVMAHELATRAFALDLEMEDVVEGRDVAFHAAHV